MELLLTALIVALMLVMFMVGILVGAFLMVKLEASPAVARADLPPVCDDP